MPLNISGRSIGHMIISLIVFFANSNPEMSSHFTSGLLDKISLSINSISYYILNNKNFKKICVKHYKIVFYLGIIPL